jgi:hypothetical protein
MDLSGVHHLYEDLVRHRATFYYSGRFSEDHSPLLISLAEAITADKEDGVTARKLAFVLVEAYQNIIRHRAPQRGPSSILLQARSGGYLLSAMNPVRREEVPVLEEMLANIARHRDLKELKEMFLRRLQGESTSQRGGAGLGLIEMARRSSHGIQHHIDGTSEDAVNFRLMLAIGNGMDRDGAVPFGPDLSNAILVYHGELSPRIQAVLHSIVVVEMLPMGDHASRYTNAFLTAMEMLSESEGQTGAPMIVLSKDDEYCSIRSALLLTEHKALEMQAAINAADEQALIQKSSEYRKRLLGRRGANDGPALGLLDLVRRAKAPIDMAVFPHGKDRLLVIDVKI